MPRPANPEKKEEIIKIASRLFYEQGYHVTGIKQIIEEAGIAKGTFYSHFRSKEALGVAWLEGWGAGQEEADADTAAPAEQILSMFNGLKSWMKQQNYRGCAFLNTTSETPDADSPLHTVILRNKKALRNHFLQLVQACYPDLSKSRQSSQATVFYLLFEGAIVESQLYRELWPIDAAKKEVERQLKSA